MKNNNFTTTNKNVTAANNNITALKNLTNKTALSYGNLGLNTGVWKVMYFTAYKEGKTVKVNGEIYTTATVVANNIYNNVFTVPAAYRPKVNSVVTAIATNDKYGGAVACGSMVLSNGNWLFCIPDVYLLESLAKYIKENNDKIAVRKIFLDCYFYYIGNFVSM